MQVEEETEKVGLEMEDALNRMMGRDKEQIAEGME